VRGPDASLPSAIGDIWAADRHHRSGSSLSGSSGKSPDARHSRDARPSARSMASATAPEERVTMLVPVGRRLVDGPADLLPRLEPPTLQGQRPQDLPPRLDPVEVRRVRRLEDEVKKSDYAVGFRITVSRSQPDQLSPPIHILLP